MGSKHLQKPPKHLGPFIWQITLYKKRAKNDKNLADKNNRFSSIRKYFEK